MGKHITYTPLAHHKGHSNIMNDWTPKKIKSELILAEVSQADIARRLNISRGRVAQVVAGAVSDPVRRAIAEAVGRDVAEIWPSYYASGELEVGAA